MRGIVFAVFLVMTPAAALRRLPVGRLTIGYATSRSLDEDKVVAAVRGGVNVVIFAFAHLADGSVNPTFDVGAARAAKARCGSEAAFLVAFGGWNGPHPETSLDGDAWFAVFQRWNAANGDVFDGIDWDLEGHDDARAPTAELSPATVDSVVAFSRAAKAAGFAVLLAPAESYLDAKSSAFNLRLDNQPLAPWAGAEHFPATFPYAGRNAYARILRDAGVETFDVISVQLYEGYSRACHALTVDGVDLGSYLAAAAKALVDGWTVDFDDGPARIAVPADRLAFGFANAWADGAKFLRAEPEAVAAAVAAVEARYRPRGVMFWVIDEEGDFAPRLTAAYPPPGTEL